MKIIRITSRKEEADALNHDLEQNNNKDKCFILHFFMKGCIHCENLEPKMKNIEKHMTNEPKYNNVTLGKIDAEMMNDVNVENAYEFPTLKVIKNGETHQYKGAPEESAILTWINSLVKDSAPTQGVHLSNHNSLGRRSLQLNSNKVNVSGVNASGVNTRKHKKKHGKSRKHGKTRKQNKTKKMKKNKKRENNSRNIKSKKHKSRKQRSKK